MNFIELESSSVEVWETRGYMAFVNRSYVVLCWIELGFELFFVIVFVFSSMSLYIISFLSMEAWFLTK